MCPSSSPIGILTHELGKSITHFYVSVRLAQLMGGATLIQFAYEQGLHPLDELELGEKDDESDEVVLIILNNNKCNMLFCSLLRLIQLWADRRNQCTG